MNINFSKEMPTQSNVLVVPVFSGQKLGKNAQKLDKELGGIISARMKTKDKFQGQTGQTLSIPVDESYGVTDVVLLGMGKPDALSKQSIRALGSTLRNTVAATQEKNAAFMSDSIKGISMGVEELAAHLMDSVNASAYTFKKYKQNANQNTGIENLTALVKAPTSAENLYDELSSLTESANWARDLGNEPPNKLTPAEYAKRISAEMQEYHNVKVTVLDEDDMKARNMGGILAVTQGSTKNPARMVIVEYDGTNGKQERPLGLVGKGVTFDTGGYNVKPGGSMTGMKMDMCGSANVMGAMRALAARGANVRAVAVVGLAENMIDGHAFRPEDVITTMSGKTVEIGNTDAEGRLILADALTLIQQDYNPDVVLDFATLTGAMLMALADTYTGVFPNDDALWSAIEKAGQESGEPGWRMPVLNKAFSNAMKGRISDLTNLGSMRGAGASTAAAFLHEFIEKDKDGNDKTRWAHFDIAGTSSKGGLASGVGVRLLDQFVRNQYESKAPGQKLDFSSAPQSQYG